MSAAAVEARACSPSPVGCHRPRPDAQLRLVAFAHAGAGPRHFQGWSEVLGPRIELWHVTLPGRGARWREPFARTWTPLVDELAAAIARVVPSPVALFGHSLGALLAFEVARWLTRAGAPPAHAVFSGRAAPDVAPSIEVPASDEALLRHVDLTSGGLPASLCAVPEVLEHFLPMLRADLELARSYAPKPGVILTCPITAVTGRDDPIAPPSALEGWRSQTACADCVLHVLPGGHFALVEAERELLALLLRRLVG